MLKVDPDVKSMRLSIDTRSIEQNGSWYLLGAQPGTDPKARWVLVPYMVVDEARSHEWQEIVYNPETKGIMHSKAEAWAGMIAYARMRPDGLPKDDCQDVLELSVAYTDGRFEAYRGVRAIQRAWIDIVLEGVSGDHGNVRDHTTEEDTGMDKAITTASADSMVVLAGYEARLDTYRQQVVGGYIGIGQVLIEAKESGVIQHGNWTSWVQEHAGLSERNAQRCMQAAREIGEGSALRKLDMSKAMALLSSGLGEDVREEIAARAADHALSTRAVQDAINDARAKAYSEGAAKTRESLMPELDRQRNMVDKLKGDIAQSKAEAEQIANQACDERADLLRKLQAMRERAESSGSGANAESKAEVVRLEELLARKDAERRAAQQELLQIKAKLAQGAAVGAEDDGTLTADAVASAVRSFLGSAGALPHMGAQLAQMELGRRQAYQTYVSMVADWVRGASAALDMVQGGGSCE